MSQHAAWLSLGMLGALQFQALTPTNPPMTRRKLMDFIFALLSGCWAGGDEEIKGCVVEEVNCVGSQNLRNSHRFC